MRVAPPLATTTSSITLTASATAHCYCFYVCYDDLVFFFLVFILFRTRCLFFFLFCFFSA